jgi:DNA-binding SARP family transcriptional activator
VRVTLRIALLGEVTVESDGRRLALPTSGKATALLVWLALNPGEHPRSRVAPLLWPDVLDASARASLRTAVWALRSALEGPGDALVSTRSTLGLREAAVWVDVLELRRLEREGLLAEAAALAHAELAPGVEEEWLEPVREAHRGQLSDIFERLARAAEGEGDASEAAVWSRRRVWLDPLDEETQQVLLRRLAALGDRAGALHSFTRFRTRLRTELGLAPSPETLALVASIRAFPLEAPELPARLAAAVGETIVGRERELERLLARFAEARSAPLPVVVALAAEPGVGKTRLVAELARRVLDGGSRVVYGASGPDAIFPYQPVVEALSEGVGATLDELIAEAGGDEGGASRYRLFERVAGLVGGLAEPAAALVALDDLHWGDVSTMQLLRHVARSHRARGAMLVLAYRPSELGAPLADLMMDLNRERPLERISLEGLTEPDIAALLRVWGADDAEPQVQALRDRTDGNPFFLREVMRDIAEGGDPRESVPTTVRDVVRARLSRLDPASQALVAAGAVAGPSFDPAAANAVLADPTEARELAGLVDGLVGSGLVDDSDVGGLLRFEHTLVRDAIYGDLGSARRAVLHRSLADGLIATQGAGPGPHLAEIAHHLRAAGAPRAVEWTIAAAEYAFDRLAFDQAGRLYAQALAGLTPGDDRRGTVARRRAMASQLVFHSMFDQAGGGGR